MGGANNKLRNFEKSLKYLEKSASMGNLSALAFLTKTYKIGNKQMNILPDSAKYSKYAAMLAKSDIEVRRMEFFRDYLEDTLKKVRENKNLIDKKVVIEYMNPVYRSLPHSANVSFEMAKLYLNGCDDLQIAQDENAAFILFHLAVNKQLANDVFDYLESFFVQGRGKFIQDNDAVQRYRIVRKLF